MIIEKIAICLIILTSLLMIDSILIDGIADVTNYPGDKCLRNCAEQNEQRVCYFKWHLEHYHVLGPACGKCGQVNGTIEDCFNPQCIAADGFERGVMSINRQIPGPAIHVCQHDVIIVDVINMMGGTTTTIHWHGFHQKQTPWMDGVPYITQCPINFGSTFRYFFNATQPGTQFYHSHSGHHKVNGLYGGIVVRRPLSEDPNLQHFDNDDASHLMVISDWMESSGEDFMPGLRSHPIGTQPTNLLINGKGVIIDPETGRPRSETPLAVFRVRSGQRYRFRFINSMSHVCPVKLEIQNHSMQVIASDSYDLQPVTVDSLVSTSGERYDFVINAKLFARKYYFMRLKGLGPCADRRLEQFAILSYDKPFIPDEVLSVVDIPDFGENMRIDGTFLNHPNTTCGEQQGKKDFCITDLASYVEDPEVTDGQPDYKFSIGFMNYRQTMKDVFGDGNYGHFMNIQDSLFVGGINNISFTFPPFSLLSQPENIDESAIFCDEMNLPRECESKQICPCLHRLKVPLNSIVEFLVFDDISTVNNLNHPFHLHGYQLFVTEMGQRADKQPMTSQLAQEMLHEIKLISTFASKLSPKRYVLKDTISIPSKGYTRFRLRADNPGFWLLHCHYEWHMAVGMGLVVQVGELKEMIPPPDNFPKCNSFTPNQNFFSPYRR